MNKKTTIFFDCETIGLNTAPEAFLCGTLLNASGDYIQFKRKQSKEMWNEIVDRAKKLKKLNKSLLCIAHNCAYDFFCLYAKNNPYAQILTPNPFICDINAPDYTIKFVDSTGIFKMSLQELGETIGIPKIDIEIETQTECTEELLKYNLQDCEILRQAYTILQERLKANNIKGKKFLTIGSLAKNHYLNLFKDIDKNIVLNGYSLGLQQTMHSDICHEAYRGGMIRVFQQGTFTDVTILDNNNNYNARACDLPSLPILSSEKYVSQILAKDKWKFINEYFWGVSTLTLKVPDIPIGVLPVRFENESIYPVNCEITGTWTHPELIYAKSLGYEIVKHFQSVIYPETQPNHLRPFFITQAENRRNAQHPFDTWLFKNIPNHLIGKFGQINIEYEHQVIDNELTSSYIELGYKVLQQTAKGVHVYKMLQMKPAAWYAPIIAAVITAKSRINLAEKDIMIGNHRMLYNDTDSLIFTGSHEEFKNIIISKELGDWKIVKQNSNVRIIAKKYYVVDGELKASGIPKKVIAQYNGENEITFSLMKKDLIRGGEFVEKKRNLASIEATHLFNQSLAEKNESFIDTGFQKELVLQRLNDEL